MAGWQSGYAADCNSVYAGSIPTPASKSREVIKSIPYCPGGEIGRRKGLKIPKWSPWLVPYSDTVTLIAPPSVLLQSLRMLGSMISVTRIEMVPLSR